MTRCALPAENSELHRKFDLIQEAHTIVLKRDVEAKLIKAEARGAKQMRCLLKRKSDVEPSNVARKRRESRGIVEKMSGMVNFIGLRK